MPMYDVPNLEATKPEGPEVPIRKVRISIPTPDTESLINLLTDMLRMKRLTYISIYPKSMDYEYILPEGIDEIIDWFKLSRQGD